MMETFKIAIAFVLGAILMVSGGIHLQNPYRFYDSVLRYELVGRNVALILAMTLPFLHIWIAAGLFFKRSNSLLELASAVGLFSVYSFVVASAWVRGLKIHCGCFGESDGEIGLHTVLRNLLLLIAAIVLLLNSLKGEKND
jgi:membrane protease YdiL (CAAX protease family)